MAAAGIGLLYTIPSLIYTVDGGHRAIKFSRIQGLKSRIYREGWHLRLPYFEWPIIYDVRTHPKVLNSKTGSKDLQIVDITIRVLYRPNPERLADLYRLVGKDYDERVLPSIVNEVVKTVVVPIYISTVLRPSTTPPSSSTSERQSASQSVRHSKSGLRSSSSSWTMSPS